MTTHEGAREMARTEVLETCRRICTELLEKFETSKISFSERQKDILWKEHAVVLAQMKNVLRHILGLMPPHSRRTEVQNFIFGSMHVIDMELDDIGKENAWSATTIIHLESCIERMLD
jgi:hypothetical protein